MKRIRFAMILWILLLQCFSFTVQAAPAPLELVGLEVQKSAVVNLGNGIGEVAVFTARDGSSRMQPWVQGVVRWDLTTKSWQVLHQSRHYFDTIVDYQIAALLPGKVQQVILTQRAGSGGFLSYEVFAAVDGKFQTLLTRSQIFLGHVRVQGEMLVEESGDLATVWVWQEDRFVSRPFSEPLPALRVGDQVVRYGIDEAGMAWVEKSQVTLKPGMRLYLRREGGGGVARVLYRGNQVIEHDEKSYLAKNTGLTDIIITPHGYEHDKAKKIDIEVRE